MGEMLKTLIAQVTACVLAFMGLMWLYYEWPIKNEQKKKELLKDTEYVEIAVEYQGSFISTSMAGKVRATNYNVYFSKGDKFLFLECDPSLYHYFNSPDFNKEEEVILKYYKEPVFYIGELYQFKIGDYLLWDPIVEDIPFSINSEETQS